jgi:CubicO group peptidase (beta-lactamase class C family)
MAGERVAGSGDWAQIDDRFDVGSLAKPMTAVAAAMVVEEGKLDWQTCIIDVFPEWKDAILPVYQNVTLEQLLAHRSGLDQWMNSNERFAAWNKQHATETATEKRLSFCQAALNRPPRYRPGTEHYYCNDGYFIAGSMIERVTGQPFEELIRHRLFEPLQLVSAKFGFGSTDRLDASVWGHEDGAFGRTKPLRPDTSEFGDPPFGSPGGFLHITVPDLLRYVNFHIEGANRRGKLLKSDSFARLFTPLPNQNYALGWDVELKRDPAGKIIERSIYHGGYSGRFRANMWFCPESQWGTVIVCNHGRGEGAEMAQVFLALVQEFGQLDRPAGRKMLNPAPVTP